MEITDAEYEYIMSSHPITDEIYDDILKHEEYVYDNIEKQKKELNDKFEAHIADFKSWVDVFRRDKFEYLNELSEYITAKPREKKRIEKRKLTLQQRLNYMRRV
jgi:hypothetical protein